LARESTNGCIRWYHLPIVKFVHLHSHSYYSFLDGVPSPQALVDAAIQFDMPALALTDHHGLTGALEFYEACQAARIKPILGLELTVEHSLGVGNLILLAIDLEGWSSLCRLSSAAQTAPHRDPGQGIPFELLAENAIGLICLTGGVRGLIHQLFGTVQHVRALDFLFELRETFRGSIYVELQANECIRDLADLAEQAKLPVVATNNIHYIDPGEAELQRTLSAIRLNCRLSELGSHRGAVSPPGSYFASGEDMAARLADYPEAIANTFEIAERCHLELPLGVPHYPEISLPPGKTALEVLGERADRGAKDRYGSLTNTISSRLEHELKIIGERGYAPLFLIMAEIMDFTRTQGVPTASRGSAASSLVAHCLGITTPDPLALNLYFERFLNPSRSSPPDIDTDLCSKRREIVIQHVYEQYGHERVAMVATINRFRRRSALREVAKTHGLPEKTIKEMTAGLPRRGWSSRSRAGIDSADPFGELIQRYPTYRSVFKQAGSIQNYPRHLSIHPGGMVIAPGPLNDIVPTHLAGKGVIITQFDLGTIEKFGLVKIDLLGTRGLSVLGDVAEQLRAWKSAEFRGSLDVLDAIPEDDPDTAEMVRSATTIGCFAIESPGMRATLKEIDAHSPEDIMIALALYRPGPLTGGLKDAFVQRHLGVQPVKHLHPALSTLLENTYGVILYQEQVLRIASELAGLSLADADILRRAMSHFDPGKQMMSLKERFVSGAEQKNGVPRETSEQIWDLMAAFAGYGFPKAHAASYAQVAWRSTWCKSHYPAEFMAAVMANWGGYYRQRVYLNEARRMGISLRPPHINYAERYFGVRYPEGEPTLYMGLDQVRELTRRTQKRILDGRPFHSLNEFLTRVDPRPKEAENLIRVGALRGLGTIPELLTQIQGSAWRYQQPRLVDLSSESETSEWNLADRVAAQEQILGAGLDAHPLELAAALVDQANAITTLEAIRRKDESVRVAGVRQTLQRFHNQVGEAFYILELEDLGGVLKVLLTPDQRRYFRGVLSGTRPLVVEGVMDLLHVSGEPVLRVEKCWGLR